MLVIKIRPLETVRCRKVNIMPSMISQCFNFIWISTRMVTTSKSDRAKIQLIFEDGYSERRISLRLNIQKTDCPRYHSNNKEEWKRHLEEIPWHTTKDIRKN